MAFDQHLADRIRQIFQEENALFTEKKMFGGLCYLMDEKMCVGIIKNELMARVGQYAYDDCLAKDYCREMDFTGRAMKGYVFVSPEGIDTDDDLRFFVQKAIHFNPLAKSSKKKK